MFDLKSLWQNQLLKGGFQKVLPASVKMDAGLILLSGSFATGRFVVNLTLQQFVLQFG